VTGICIRTAFGVALLLLTLAATGSAQAAEAVAWDQARATQLAVDLDKAVKDLSRTARTEQLEAQDTKNAQAYLMVEDLKSLSRYSKRLARHLGEGAGQADTERLFERMLMIVRSLRDQRASSPLLANSTGEIDKAREMLEQLAQYYGKTLPPPVAAPGTKE
jgi:hypothetical protein